MNIRNGWRGAMRRALEASNIVVGAEKQIPRGPGSAGDDKSEEPSTAKEQQFLRPGRGLANASSLLRTFPLFSNRKWSAQKSLFRRDAETNTRDACATPRHCNEDWTFGFRHSFVLRHSCFVIVQCREQEQGPPQRLTQTPLQR